MTESQPKWLKILKLPLAKPVESIHVPESLRGSTPLLTAITREAQLLG